MMIQAILETKYVGPTDSYGSRIRVKNLITGKSHYWDYDYSLGGSSNHNRAACYSIDLLGLDYCEVVETPIKTGYLVVALAK